MLRAQHMPEVEVILVEEPEPEGPFGAKGVGEIGLVPTAGAVAGALAGVRRRAAHAPADEGFARRARHQSRPHSPTASATNGIDRLARRRPRSQRPQRGDRRRPRRRRGASRARRELACADGEIEPGAVCAHTHLYSGLARYGMPPPDPPPASFLRDPANACGGGSTARSTPDSLRAAARDYVARALLAGTTTLVDHHESPNLIEGSLAMLAEACERTRRCARCSATARPSATSAATEARRGLAECRRVAASPLVRGLVGLHASFTVSDETIREAGALARELGTVVHVHVAEDQADVDDARRRGYAGPLERLLALGALLPGSILAHGVQLSRDAGAAAPPTPAAGSCTTRAPTRATASAMPARCPRRRGWRLGTDGWDADMAAEEAALLRLADAEWRRWRRRTAGGGPSRWRRSVSAREAEPLAPGALGDLVVRRDGAVRHVVVGGRVVVENGALATADIESITARARAEAARLWSRMAAI